MPGPRVTAQIAQLYVRSDETYIVLDIKPGSENRPKDGLFHLTHGDNYTSQYALALAAAANRWPLLIRVVGDHIPTDDYATIDYLTVTWIPEATS
jgi:hypothetical protein